MDSNKTSVSHRFFVRQFKAFGFRLDGLIGIGSLHGFLLGRIACQMRLTGRLGVAGLGKITDGFKPLTRYEKIRR